MLFSSIFQPCRILTPHQGLSPRPLQWKPPALTPGHLGMSLSRAALSGACQRQLTEAPDHPVPSCPLRPVPGPPDPAQGHEGTTLLCPFRCPGESRQACASWFMVARASCGHEGEQTHPESTATRHSPPSPSPSLPLQEGEDTGGAHTLQLDQRPCPANTLQGRPFSSTTTPPGR